MEGTLATVLLELESERATPPVPAGSVRLIVPVAVWPLTMLLGLTETLPRAAGAGFTVTPNVALTPE
jgi:hypothetical protein